MLSELDEFYLKHNEPLQSCLLGLRDIILSVDSNITPEWKYKLPFFYYNGKMLCYLWIHKKYKKPYIGFVDGHLLNDEDLLVEKRAKMKILLINPPFDKATAGLGLQSSVGYHFTSDRGNTDFRIINWENAVTREFGEYTRFRKGLYGDKTYTDVMVSRSEVIWTTGISSEIIFHHRKNKDYKHAFKLFIGGSPDLQKSFDNRIKRENNPTEPDGIKRGNFQFTYFFKVKNFNLTAQTDLSHFASSFGLGYTF